MRVSNQGTGALRKRDGPIGYCSGHSADIESSYRDWPRYYVEGFDDLVETLHRMGQKLTVVYASIVGLAESAVLVLLMRYLFS